MGRRRLSAVVSTIGAQTQTDRRDGSLDDQGAEASWSWLLPGLVALAFVLGKLPTLHDPHTWDALSCYLPQARFLAEHGTDWAAYRSLEYLRPPVLTGSVAVLLSLGASHAMVRIYLWLWALLGLFGAYRLTRILGGRRRDAILAMVLCAAAPIYFAQAGLLQLDLAAAVLCVWALVALFAGRIWAFVLVLSVAVLTKESSYYLCVPAALWLAVRKAGTTRPRELLRLRVLAHVLPALIPGLVLLGWLLIHRQLVGHVMATAHQDALFSLDRIASALLHNFVEGGRFPLVVLAGLALRAAWRTRRDDILLVGVAVGLLPLCFAGHPPRYMLLSLPPLCVLAALGLAELRVQPRRLAMVTVLVWLGQGFTGGSWHGDSGDHLESNLAYRELIALHRDAAYVVADARPRSVLADFPMLDVLRAPPAIGYLPAPIPVTWASSPRSYEALCQHDFLLEADGGSVEAAKQQLQPRGALELFRELKLPTQSTVLPWGQIDQRIRIYRIRCPKQSAMTVTTPMRMLAN